MRFAPRYIIPGGVCTAVLGVLSLFSGNPVTAMLFIVGGLLLVIQGWAQN